MDVGNIMEIPIIKALEVRHGRVRLGRHPVYFPRLRLRVNYDGLQFRRVIEIKTSGKEMKNVPLRYWQQAQVLMFALRRPWRKRCTLFAYQLESKDYAAPYYPEIDLKRITTHEINYDPEWIKHEYLPRLKYLAWCLKRGVWPSEESYRHGDRNHRQLR